MTPLATRTHRALLAWEHGRNFGHIARLNAMAARLGESGTSTAWVVPHHSLDTIAQKAAGGWFAASPRMAPPLPSPMQPTMAPHSFADVLAGIGFADETCLRSAVGRWLEIFEQSRANAVILDYAPCAQLAALCAGLPAAQITNGFDAPPANCPLFGITARGLMLERRNLQVISRLDHAIDRVARSFGKANGASLQALLRYPTRWYDCVSEADPYGPREDGAYIGPIGHAPDSQAVEWPAGPVTAPKVLVYLRDETCVMSVLDSLESADARVICVWPGASSDAIDWLRKPGRLAVAHPVEVPALLGDCDAVVNYGSTTFVSQILMAGKPQLMLPTDVEKWLVASRVASQGLGRVVGWPFAQAALASALLEILDRSSDSRTLAEIGRKYGSFKSPLQSELVRFIEGNGCRLRHPEDGPSAIV